MDTDLVRLAQNGDKGAFTSLAAAMADRFLAASHRILRDISLAEDATQRPRFVWAAVAAAAESLVTYQCSSRNTASRSRRPPARLAAVSLDGSVG